MQITFVSNYINHHQTPMSDELYRLTGGNYTFIQTEPMEEERVNMGWDKSAVNRPYVKLYYEDKKACDELLMTSDCVIFGGCEDENVIMPRLEAGLFTIRYSERIYRSGRWKFVSPRGLIRKYHDHVRFRKAPVYLLCAGAHVAGDYALIHAYPGKKFKFGYFTAFEQYENLNEFREKNECVNVLWVGRFMDVKHPERIVKLCRKLKEEGVKAQTLMIGDGDLHDKCVKMAESYGLGDVLSFAGSKKPAEVREYMRKADIFISTSDNGEGWGAVLNEAMNSGCATIGTYEMGAGRYLIKNGENGYLFHSRNVDALADIVKKLVSDSDKRAELGRNAYNTIKYTWNPQVAAKRLYEFIADPNHSMDKYKEGPLSKA